MIISQIGQYKGLGSSDLFYTGFYEGIRQTYGINAPLIMVCPSISPNRLELRSRLAGSWGLCWIH